jgi:hypothetical protein
MVGAVSTDLHTHGRLRYNVLAMRTTPSPLRRFLIGLPAVLLGTAAGLLLWSLALGVQVQRHEPGLWTLRVQRVIDCGLDYNGPPWTKQGIVVWLTCGEEQGWKLWPPP